MKAEDILNEPPELKRLRELSARIGSDGLLVQASSGNTSMKIDDVLWIKASGRWLIHADDPDFLISVQLGRARACLEEQTAIPETLPNSSSYGCASIETAMHAVLRQKVVVHVHSLNAIAWAVREDARRQLSIRLSGLNWRWIPYTRSGSDLAGQVEDIRSRFPATDVFVLGNHGLVIGGESCESAEQLLAEVERRLKIDVRPAPGPRLSALNKLAAASGLSLPNCPAVHALATDPASRKILFGGVLYPCQAIFLPWTVCVPESSPLKELSVFRQHRTPLLIQDHGVVCSHEMSRAEREMLVGLAGVVQRIDPSAPLRYLSFSELREVLNVDSESYRRAADANFLKPAFLGA